MTDRRPQVTEPWAYVAHKDGMMGGVCAASISKKSLKDFMGKFAADGFTLSPMSNREEYLAFIKDMPMTDLSRCSEAKADHAQTMLELADKINGLLDAYLMTDDEGENAAARSELEDALWDNKAGIISFLRLRAHPAIGAPDGAREALIERCAKIADPWPGFNVGQKITEPDLSVIEVRTKIAAAIRALAAIPREQGAKPVAWQYRCMYDKGHVREKEWCEWHDCTEAWFNKINADIAAGKKHLETRALYAAPPSDSPGRADYKIGRWLSAALEDPNVCAEMKADINAWFETHQPPGGDAREIADKIIADPTVIWLRECGFNSSAKFESELHSAIMRALYAHPSPDRPASAQDGMREALNRIIFFPFIKDTDFQAVRAIAKEALAALPPEQDGSSQHTRPEGK